MPKEREKARGLGRFTRRAACSDASVDASPDSWTQRRWGWTIPLVSELNLRVLKDGYLRPDAVRPIFCKFYGGFWPSACMIDGDVVVFG